MNDRDTRIALLMAEEGCTFEGAELVVYLCEVSRLDQAGDVSEAHRVMEEFGNRRSRATIDRLTEAVASANRKIGELEAAIELTKIDARRAGRSAAFKEASGIAYGLTYPEQANEPPSNRDDLAYQYGFGRASADLGEIFEDLAAEAK